MVRAHHADADHADPQCAVRACLCRLTHDSKGPQAAPIPDLPLAWPGPTGDPNGCGTGTRLDSIRCNAGVCGETKVSKEKHGEFPRKTGWRLSINGQSLRPIRDLGNFFQSKKQREN